MKRRTRIATCIAENPGKIIMHVPVRTKIMKNSNMPRLWAVMIRLVLVQAEYQELSGSQELVPLVAQELLER